MDSVKLIRSLGILLDNAMEELDSNSVEGFLKVGIIKRDNSLLIVISNSCRDNIPKLFELQRANFSTKGLNRGLGLSNLREIINSLGHVTLETNITKNVFTQIIEINQRGDL